MEILNTIHSPADVKKLQPAERQKLAEEIRKVLIEKVNATGGHMGPNLGMVEMTIALHTVFDSPKDKIVFDVSHQCYTHKMLTGRKEAFLYPDQYGKYSGYTNQDESEHDFFKIGHTATSVSLAVGLAKARDLQKKQENILAVIGDGSLSGGEAYEGFNNAAILDSNILLVVNDNEMSIAENQGGLYRNLRILRESKGQAECNVFKALGFEYHYLDEGNDVEALIALFRQVKDTNKPTVLHVHTLKGKGLSFAEENEEAWHWVMPGAVDRAKKGEKLSWPKDYSQLTTEYIGKKYQEDPSVVVITAATPGVSGLTAEFRKAAGEHFMDVGIAEEHAVAMASGIAANGGKPILEIYSSFLQRTYDQVSQDLALNQYPATMLVFGGGISGADMTHLCVFDIPLLSNIPNLVYLAPTCQEEYLAMLDWSVEQMRYPVAIRVPNTSLVSCGKEIHDDYGDELNTYEVTAGGEKIAILALGSFYGLGEDLKKELQESLGIQATLINPRYISGIDENLLRTLKTNHQMVVTLEDGVLDGGFGEKIARFYGPSTMKVLNFGAKKEFTDRVSQEELYQRYHLTPKQMAADIKAIL